MKETLQSIDERLHGKHSFMSEELLAPFFNQTNQSRGQMFTSHIGQCIQLENSEVPLVFTGFENQVGKYSSGYRELEGKWIVLDKIQKNALNYLLLIQNIETKEYDILLRSEGGNLTESFGFMNDNTKLDSLTPGDKIDSEVIRHDLNYDSEMNLKYGANLRICYLPYKGYTNEDAIVISESTAKRLTSPFVAKVVANINTNDILLNLYGDGDKYKTFPNVGENVKSDGILLSHRRIAHSEIINKFHDRLLNQRIDGDTSLIVSKHTKVIDIDIWSNNHLDKMNIEPYNEQVTQQYVLLKAYYKKVVDLLEPIVRDLNKKVSRDLRTYFNRVASFLDPVSEFEVSGKRFDNIVIEFTILYTEPIVVGSKLTSRYGSKGVISKIVPDEEMPTLTSIDGEPVRDDTGVNLRADLVCNPFGINNRLNISVMVELELNYISTIIRYRMEKMDDYKEQWKLLEKFLKLTDKDKENYEAYSTHYKSLKVAEKKEFLKDIINNGIRLKQEPFWRNINSLDIYNIYNEMGVDLYPNNLSKNNVPIGEMYYLRLKHEPSKKMSARSVDNLNMSGLPTKTKDNKNFTARINNNPIRLGEMEVSNLSLPGSLKPVSELLDAYSNNSNDRRSLAIKLLTSNPFDLEINEPSNEIGSDNMILNSYLYSMGVSIDKDFEDTRIDLLEKELNPEQIEFFGYILEKELEEKTLDEIDIDELIEEAKEFDGVNHEVELEDSDEEVID